jgi:hypothetical protein
MTGVVSAIPAAFCIWATTTLVDRVVAPVLAEHRDPLTVGCGILFLGLLALTVIYALAGAAAVAWCDRLITNRREADRTGWIAGTTGSVVSYVFFLVPGFRQGMSNDPNLYSLGPAHTAFAFAGIIVGLAFYGVLYWAWGSVFAVRGGTLYYKYRANKERK